MADEKNNPYCPAAALADEAIRLIDAHSAVDEASGDGENKIRLDAIMNTTIEALDAVLQRASWVEAQSTKGALFQICAVSDMLGLITGSGQNCPSASAAAKAVYRMLHSIAAYIELNGDGARFISAGAKYYLNPAIGQHEHLHEAMMMAEARAKEAA